MTDNTPAPFDPYAIQLAEGETIVREGWSIRYSNLGYYTDRPKQSFSFDPLEAYLNPRLHAPSYGSDAVAVHITVIRTPERRELVEVECDGWVRTHESGVGYYWSRGDDGASMRTGLDGATILGSYKVRYRPIKLIPGTERAVVRRVVPGPIIEEVEPHV